VWVAGNHDVIEDGSGDTVLTPLAALHHAEPGVVQVAGAPTLIDWKGHRKIVCLPFAASSHAYDADRVVRELVGDRKDPIVLGHLTVPGLIPGEEAHELPRGRDVMFPLSAFDDKPNALLMNGHHHRRDTEGRVKIPGTLARLTFGEDDNEPGFLVLEVS
jgi:hypothetical protein